jgi:hypothetical protein
MKRIERIVEMMKVLFGTDGPCVRIGPTGNRASANDPNSTGSWRASAYRDSTDKASSLFGDADDPDEAVDRLHNQVKNLLKEKMQNAEAKTREMRRALTGEE